MTKSSSLVRRMRFLSADNFRYSPSPLEGGGVMPHALRVAGQTCRCSRVPMSSKHSWHLRSSVLKGGTAAFRTWGHWPPLMADAASAFHAFFQGCANRFSVHLPFKMGARAVAKSMIMVLSPALAAPTSSSSENQARHMPRNSCQPPSAYGFLNRLANGRRRVAHEIPGIAQVIDRAGGLSSSPADEIGRAHV